MITKKCTAASLLAVACLCAGAARADRCEDVPLSDIAPADVPALVSACAGDGGNAEDEAYVRDYIEQALELYAEGYLDEYSYPTAAAPAWVQKAWGGEEVDDRSDDDANSASVETGIHDNGINQSSTLLGSMVSNMPTINSV